MTAQPTPPGATMPLMRTPPGVDGYGWAYHGNSADLGPRGAAMRGLYAGPVIDPHHHLWDLSLRRHPWLSAEAVRDPAADSVAAIRRSYCVDDYLQDARGQNIVATVHIEANWSEVHVEDESRWLRTLKRRGGVARRHVARVPLHWPDAAQRLQAEAEDPDCVGIRDIVSWHPDAARSFVAAPNMLDDPAWRRGLAALAPLGLVFDLMLFPWQLAQATRLAAAFPETLFVLNHCGSPVDRTAEGMQLWRDGLTAIGRADNVIVKISDPVAYDTEWTFDSLRQVIEHCLSCFGTRRAMFASDFPVTGLHATFAEIYDVFRRVASGLSAAEQRDLFFGTANRTYRLGLDANLQVNE